MAERSSFVLGEDPMPDWFMERVTNSHVILHTTKGERDALTHACICNTAPIVCARRGQVIELDRFGRIVIKDDESASGARSRRSVGD